MAEILKEDTKNALEDLTAETFKKMDHEPFKTCVGLKFDSIKTSVDTLIRSAHRPEQHFIGEVLSSKETFKEEEIEDDFKDALEVLDATPSTLSPMTSTTPSPRSLVSSTATFWI